MLNEALNKIIIVIRTLNRSLKSDVLCCCSNPRAKKDDKKKDDKKKDNKNFSEEHERVNKSASLNYLKMIQNDEFKKMRINKVYCQIIQELSFPSSSKIYFNGTILKHDNTCNGF